MEVTKILGHLFPVASVTNVTKANLVVKPT